MKAPYYNLVADEDAKITSKILLSDITPVKFKRRRALNCTFRLFTVADSYARSRFDDGCNTYKGAYSKRAYARNNALYFVAFPVVFFVFTVVFAAIIFGGTLHNAMAEIPALLVFLLICWIASGAAAGGLAVWRIYKGKYLKKVFNHLDDVYILYGKNGAPCCVCVEEYGVRVLYGEKLYFADMRGSGVITDDPKKIYLEYLDLFPQSVLDMDTFVKERKKYFLAADAGYRKDVTAVFCEMDKGSSLSVNATSINVTLWKLRKVLYDFNKDLNLDAVYSIVGRSWAEYITFAKVEKRGEEVKNELESIKELFPELKKLLEEIL